MRNIKNIIICFSVILLISCNPRTEDLNSIKFYDHLYTICIYEDLFWTDAARENGLGNEWYHLNYLDFSLTCIYSTKALVKAELDKVDSFFVNVTRNNSLPEWENSENIRIALRKRLSNWPSNAFFQDIVGNRNVVFLSYFKFDIIFKTPYGYKKYKNLIYIRLKYGNSDSLIFVVDGGDYYMLS